MTVGEGSVLAGRYRLGRLLGRGGMADVFRATDEVLHREVAVKVLREAAEDSSAQARFSHEGRTLAKLSHPSLVTVLDAGTDGDVPFLVLHLVHGRSLAEVLRSGPLPLDRVSAIGSAVAGALAHVHESGVVHRDVKPGNVLLTDDGDALLADFGIARLLADTTRHTRTGLTIGTAAYLSPEQVRGESVTPASDVYSLALVLIEALTGQPAYAGPATEAALARLHQQPALPETLPATARDLLTAMTSADPVSRPAAAGVETALPAALAGAPSGDLSGSTRVLPVQEPAHSPAHEPVIELSSSAGSRRRSLPLALAVGVLVAVVALYVLLNGGTGGPSEEGGAGGSLPEGVPSQLQEPLADLHDAVEGTD